MDWSVTIDIVKYCRELQLLNDINAEHRPMEERYFVKRYKFGKCNLLCCWFKVDHCFLGVALTVYELQPLLVLGHFGPWPLRTFKKDRSDQGGTYVP